MKNIVKYILVTIISLTFIGCNSGDNTTTESENIEGSANAASNNATGVEIIYKDGLTLTEVKDNSDLANATLKLVTPDLSKKINEGSVAFTYETNGIEIGKNGFINFSLNNALVKSYSTNTFIRNLPEGDFIFTSFLVDNNGKSIKSKNANILKLIKVGSYSEGIVFNKDSAHLLYNKPQGTYTGDAAKHILLDFVVVNTKLSKTGNRVKVLINGTEFILNKWKSYTIDGLPMGENVIKIDLINDLGVVPGPFNRGEERIITLAEAS